MKHLRMAARAAAFASCALAGQLRAQHQHDMAAMTETNMPVQPFGIAMNRMGSGTTWIPDAVRVPAAERMAGGWHLVMHGFAFGTYNHQAGPRGDDLLGSTNWMMLMASRTVAGGRFQLRSMLSLDPATTGGRGYPLLLQSGESYQGAPIRDRQHPHDFWMELGVQYERALSRGVGLLLYAAPAGEPALGPVAFMHRPSSMDDPAAPLSHHWQDATHISFGVLTAGLFGRAWKIEASRFNGTEPDEHRWGFDRIRLDSWAARLTINPDSSWSMTVGYGTLANPEASAPAEPVHRTTASVLYGTSNGHRQLAVSLVWGMNREGGQSRQAGVLETEAMLDQRNTIIARGELVQKSAADLGVLPPAAVDSTFTVASLSAGYIREVARLGRATLGLGARGTINALPSWLSGTYGSRYPVGLMIFARLRPTHELFTMESR